MCLRRVAFFLRRKKVTNFYRKATVGRVICAPPKRKNHALKILQDQRQRRTTADNSKFRLRPTAPSCRPERIPKPWFWRAFGDFSRVGKVTRRRQTSRFGGLTYVKTRCSLKTKKAGDPVDLQPFHAFVKDLPCLALAVAVAARNGQHGDACAADDR